MRTIVVKDTVFQYKVGKANLLIMCSDGKVVIPFSKIFSEQDIDRLQRKKSFSISPNVVAAVIMSMVFEQS